MTSESMDTLSLVTTLCEPSRRAAVARQLAEHLGAGEVLLFARDPTLKILLPAPGMNQTVRGDRAWRHLIGTCPPEGRCEGEVELPIGTKCHALVLNHSGSAFVVLGGTPHEDRVTEVERLMPMLGALLTAEQELMLSRDEAAAALDDVGRAHQLATALEAARADAAELNREFREEHRRKDEFVAMLGHELRNPLAPLVTAIELVQFNGPDKPMPVNLLRIMERQVKQLSRLVEDLLDVSRVSRGHIELRRERVRLGEVLANAYEECRTLIDSRGHRFEMRGAEGSCSVVADPSRLTQIFCNLLNNAAKYTDVGGQVAVTLECVGETAIVRVQDNGIGIDGEVLPHIFNLFTQASSALGRAEGGLGIGLTLVRTLVELHGGTVTAYSEGAGQGVTMTVTLPLASVRDESVHDETPVVEPVHSEPRRIVLVDDNRDAADSASAMLRMMGHDVTVAYSGAEALLIPDLGKADLVLLDIGLPGMHGYELARRIRPSLRQDARLVALTGYGTNEGKRRSLEAGFNAHIVKPIHLVSLRRIIAETVRAPDDAASVT